MLGDIVISIETAARQAEERGHTIVDEIRILLVIFNFFFLSHYVFLALFCFSGSSIINN